MQVYNIQRNVAPVENVEAMFEATWEIGGKDERQLGAALHLLPRICDNRDGAT